MFTALLSILMLTACIPTIQRFYFAPAVIGTVIDLNTLNPVEEAKVSYVESDEEPVLTDKNGSFSLSSISEIQASFLMVGHAINENRIHVTYGAGTADGYVLGSLRSTYEEFANAAVIFIDTQPNIISKKIKPEHADYALLKSALSEQSTFGQCDVQLGYSALVALNSARKLYWTQTFGLNPMIDKARVQKSYHDVEILWRALERSCELEFEEKMKVYEITRLIISEANDVNSSTTEN